MNFPPVPSSRRFMPRLKARILNCIKTHEDFTVACKIYDLSEEELLSWRDNRKVVFFIKRVS